MVSHYVLDDGKLVVAHAGLKQGMQGRGSGPFASSVCMARRPARPMSTGCRYATTGPTTIAVARWWSTANAGALSRVAEQHAVHRYRLRLWRRADGAALSERELQQVEALRAYYESKKPLGLVGSAAGGALGRPEDLLDAEDVLGKRRVETRILSGVTVQAENAAAALESMSRFAVDPRWLIYLPPTMSPCETARAAPTSNTRARRWPTSANRVCGA